MAIVLTMSSILLCQHGGPVLCSPVCDTGYRLNGQRPLLIDDVFMISGCPFLVPPNNQRMPCITMQWLVPSSFLIVKGRPVLTTSSIGVTNSMLAGLPILIASYDASNLEPSELTTIDY